MSSLINLLISFYMSIFFGQQSQEKLTTHIDQELYHIEMLQELKTHQKLLNC